MEPTEQNRKRFRKGLTRTEQVVIYGLIILAAANAELGISDSASLDAFEQTLQTAPQKFLWPVVLLASAAGMAFLWFRMEESKLRTVLAHSTMIAFAFGMVRLTELITH